MGMLAWVMMGLALWHFTIWFPDHFWGGIVGAFLAALAGAIVSGIVIYAAVHGSAGIPGRHSTDIAVVLYAIPGALAAMAAIYAIGARREARHTSAG